MPGWLAIIFYLPTLTHGYVWDDSYFLTDMPFLRDPALWQQHILEPLFVSRNYFRPLPLLMFVAEARIGDLNPFVFHLVNVLLHALNVTLLVLLARTLLPQDRRGMWLASAAGLLFGLHPALVESVAWISDRFDLLMTTWILLALWCERHMQASWRRLVVLALLFLLALLSKETGVLLLVLLPLWQLLAHFQKGQGWQGIINYWRQPAVWQVPAVLLLTLLLYLGIRYSALGFLYHGDAKMASGNVLQHLLLIGKTLGWYAWLAVFPFGFLGPVHPAQTPLPLSDMWAWLGLLGIAGIGLILLRGLWQGRSIAVLALAALCALVPVSNLLPLTIGDNIVHDRYLMLPVAFLALALTYVLHRRELSRERQCAAVWLLAAAVTVVLIVPNWESNLSLWSWAYAKYPESQIARENYVSALVNTERNVEAVAVSRHILRTYPETASTVHNLALALARMGEFAAAEIEIKHAISLQQSYDGKTRLDVSEAWNLLAYIHMHQQRWQEAEADLREAIRLSPYLTRPHYNLALVLYERGELQAGDEELAFAVRYGSPELAASHQRLGQQRRSEVMQRLKLNG
ncbi:MAG TPA: tetratricopeptide repeat protein [Rhodocyclaceae bacterium]|nr:tetratricopeptide repeat protein [Rhodocyclaceae bacterium]